MLNDIVKWWKSKEVRKSRRALILILSFFALVWFYKHGKDYVSPEDPYSLNIHTEVIGVALSVLITVFVIDALNRRRDEERREQESKERLLREVRSPNNLTARNAIHELRDKGWLTGEGGLLRGKNLDCVNWQNTTLTGANLEGAEMWDADMSGEESALEEVNFRSANLTAASFIDAWVGPAIFENANLQNADLRNTFLAFATFKGANLVGADLRGAMKALPATENSPMSKNMILPDGSKWTPETDIGIYTDPDHPDFWRSDDSNSPAHPDFDKSRPPHDQIDGD